MTERRNNPSDPTAERTEDESMPAAGGIAAVEGTGAPVIRPREEEDDDLIARNSEDARATPRRYERDVREES